VTTEPELPPSTASIPDLIRVQRHGRQRRIYVDGVEFPYATAGVAPTEVGTDDWPSVTLTIPANRVEVVDTLDASDPAEGS
jgi:hypothetical protein